MKFTTAFVYTNVTFSFISFLENTSSKNHEKKLIKFPVSVFFLICKIFL